MLKLRDRLAAWATPKEELQRQVKAWQTRVHALQAETHAALRNALHFENADLTGWMQDFASSDKGELGEPVNGMMALLHGVRRTGVAGW